MTDRLGVFTGMKVDAVRRQLGTIRMAPWPPLEGCLSVLFTARSGSTYLCRELESLFDIGRMGETLNPEQVRRRPTTEVVKARQDKWFAFKAGREGVIAGELHGFFDAYLGKMVFILLARRDIVAQAVSRAKATQTQQWHSDNTAQGAPVYERVKIVKAIKGIDASFEELRLYAHQSERPWRTLIYEDFSGGNFAAAVAACRSLHVPLREPRSSVEPRSVERVGDETNQAWIERFNAEMSPVTRELIEKYQSAL